MEQHSCKNCENLFEGRFCNVCGQKTAHRLDVSHIWHEVIHLFTHADKGIFAFIPKIITQPGIIALDYVEGKRKKYFNPLQYLVIIIGIVTFLIARSHFIEQVMSTITTMNSTNVPASAVKQQLKIAQFFQRYFNIIMFLLIPILSFFSWLFFRKKKFNYAEHILLQVTLQAQSNTNFVIYLLSIIVHFRSSCAQNFICTATYYLNDLHDDYLLSIFKNSLVDSVT
jgi:hypothetical protein